MATALNLTDMLALILENTEIEIYEEESMPTVHADDLVNNSVTLEQLKETTKDVMNASSMESSSVTEDFFLELHTNVNSAFAALLREKFPEKKYLSFLQELPLPVLENSSLTMRLLVRHVVCRLWQVVNEKFDEERSSISELPDLQYIATEKLMENGGWCVLRTRQTIAKSNLLLLRTDDLEPSKIGKDDALKLCSFLGKDAEDGEGKYRFILKDICKDFFLYLHQATEAFACNADRSDLQIHSSDMCLRILHFLANDKELRRRWNMLTDLPDFDKKSSLLVLKYICEFFVKMKQKQLTTKYDLQPQKTSVSLRQGLQKSAPKKSKSINPIVKDILINFEDATAVESNLQRLKSISDRVDILKCFTCQQLHKLLCSFGLPSLKGKRKEQMVASAVSHIEKSSVIVIHPEKLKCNDGNK